jgi:DNA polymerase III delta subunit
LGSFNPRMEFFPFKNTVYPALTKLSRDDGMEGLALIAKSPNTAYQALTNAGHFSQVELIDYLEMLVQIDLALKTTGQKPSLLLERFLIAVCKVNAR